MYLNLTKNNKKFILTLVLFFCSYILVSLNAQESSNKLNINLKQATLSEVLTKIKEQSNLNLIYPKTVDLLETRSDIKLENKTINQILSYLSPIYGLSYKVSGQTISIKILDNKSTIIHGIVLDQQKISLPGATIKIKNKPQTTLTNLDGEFKIEAVANLDKIEVSFIGYETQILEVTEDMTIVLKELSSDLNEIVVIGYGTTKRSDLTGAITTVKDKEITSYPVADPIQALQGRVAGVSVSQNTGNPTGDYSIRIRGVNSILGNNSPLIIVDGIPQNSLTIGSYDIETMEVLKDASATAIYGSRGANGVIIITTKRGQNQETVVNYNSDFGFQKQIKKLDLMNEKQWAMFYNEYLVNSGLLEEAPFSAEDLSKMGTGTDWQDLMFKTAPIYSHNLSFSGAKDKLHYYVSGSLLERDGLVPNSSFNKKNVRANLNIPVQNWLDLNLQLGYSGLTGFNQSQGGGAAGSSLMSAIYAASPHFYPFDESGNYKDLRTWFPWSSHELRNPVNIANESWYKTDNRISTVNANFILKLLPGLTFKSVFGLENGDSRYESYTTQKFIYSNNTAALNAFRNETKVQENILNYKFDIKQKHDFDIMAAYTTQSNTTKLLEGSGNTFLSDISNVFDLGAAEIMNSPKSKFTKWVLQSYLGRINYSFNNKYYVTGSIRADGSSRYSKGNQWGYFPSVALAWRASNEEFLIDVLEKIKISNLKVRASYGLTGSTAISPYATQNILSTGKTATENGNYSYYSPGTVYPGDLKWETTTQWDVGLDISFLNNRVNFTMDIYNKLTNDMLNRVFLPSSSGYKNTIRNIGSMSNKGIELMLDGTIIDNNIFGFTAQINFAKNRNRIEKLADGDDLFGSTHNSYASGTITILREGQALGSFYLYKDAGLDSEGRLSYEDLNNDGELTDTEDRYLAGSPFPKFTYGINTNFRYKDFELNMFWQGSQGNKVYNLSEMRNYSYGQGMNIESSVYNNSWKQGQDNSNALYPRIERVGTLRHSDRFLENGSYLRLKNIALTYNIPVHKLKKSFFTLLSVYASAQNLLTITKYKGVDPEVNSKASDIDNAIDHFTYPNTKTLSFGLKAQF